MEKSRTYITIIKTNFHTFIELCEKVMYIFNYFGLTYNSVSVNCKMFMKSD